MRELGLSGKAAHKDLADWLQLCSDEVILCGKLTREYTLPVLESKKFKVHHFEKMSELARYLKSIVKPKSYVLVKGSQNHIFLERAVEAILESKDDVSELCRRGPYWDKIRAKNP
jgi:UDP-N-acetylmuramyl pentapeptide synthase